MATIQVALMACLVVFVPEMRDSSASALLVIGGVRRISITLTYWVMMGKKTGMKI